MGVPPVSARPAGALLPGGRGQQEHQRQDHLCSQCCSGSHLGGTEVQAWLAAILLQARLTTLARD